MSGSVEIHPDRPASASTLDPFSFAGVKEACLSTSNHATPRIGHIPCLRCSIFSAFLSSPVYPEEDPLGGAVLGLPNRDPSSPTPPGRAAFCSSDSVGSVFWFDEFLDYIEDLMFLVFCIAGLLDWFPWLFVLDFPAKTETLEK